MQRVCLWGTVFFCFLQPHASPAVEYHALLIGVGGSTDSLKKPLAGPGNDVAALRDTLVATLGFPARNIKTLVGSEATKEAILQGIDTLSVRSKPGDHILVYYSGHGTSMYDKGQSRLNLPHSSGAIIPYDAKTRGDAGEIRDSLIIGSRDLRPRIKKLEKDRLVLGVFDACFSGYSFRSLPGQGSPKAEPVSRYTPLIPTGTYSPVKTDTVTIDRETYPYTNVYYISASSESQKAWDVSLGSYGGYKTFDGKPHGLFTDQFIRVLRGEFMADSNNDGRMSFGELFQAVKEPTVYHSKKHWGKYRESTPHALPKNSELQSRSFFQRKKIAVTPVAKPTLANIQYPNQSFNIAVDILGKHGHNVWLGEKLGFSMYTEDDAYLLLFNINKVGAVSVIYPYEQHELALVPAGKTVSLHNLGEVTPPLGKEILKLVAFKEKPAGYESLLAADAIRPGTDLYRQLEGMLGVRGSGNDTLRQSGAIAQHGIIVRSVEKED